jgi:hypothetical protein
MEFYDEWRRDIASSFAATALQVILSGAGCSCHPWPLKQIGS